MERLYVAGQMFPTSNGEYEFKLVGPKAGGTPYITENPNSSAMRFCGMNGSALYLVNFNEGLFVNMENPRYGRSTGMLDKRSYYERCPKLVPISDDLATEVRRAIESGETMLTD